LQLIENVQRDVDPGFRVPDNEPFAAQNHGGKIVEREVRQGRRVIQVLTEVSLDQYLGMLFPLSSDCARKAVSVPLLV
jgi:hypothetical protein